MKRLLMGTIACFILLYPGLGLATPVTVTVSGIGTGVGGTAIGASAVFTYDNTPHTLQIVLSNTAAITDVNGNALTGLFWNLSGATLTSQSATIAAGALLNPTSCNPGPCTSSTTNVGGEFRFDTSWAGTLPTGINMGLASAGYIANSGSGGNFGGSNIDDPVSMDGPNFGIVANSPAYTTSVPLILDQVTFQFSYTGTITDSDFTKVAFTYGTAGPGIGNPPEPCIGCNPGGEPVPEPSTFVLLITGIGLALAGGRNSFLRSRKK